MPWARGDDRLTAMTRTVLLALHIVGVAAWLGANFVQLVLSPRFARGPAEVAAAWTRQTIWLGQRYYNAAGAVIGVTGVLLVQESDWSWGAGFVWVGVAVLIIGAVMGGVFFAPLAKRLVGALESGDEERAAGAQSQIILLAVLDTVLVLSAVLAMVHKWQA